MISLVLGKLPKRKPDKMFERLYMWQFDSGFSEMVHGLGGFSIFEH